MLLGTCQRCTRCGACGWQIQEYEEVTSTNDLVKRAIETGAPEGTVVCAREQTGGYGRQGRTWASPAGGLYLSVLLRPDVPMAQVPTLSLVVGLAVRRAIASLVPDATAGAVQVKWPNDVVLEPEELREPLLMLPDQRDPAEKRFQKLCGISLEQHAGGICVGIGVNVERPRDARAVGGKNVAAYVTDLVPEGAAGIADVRDAILRELAFAYPLWRSEGFAVFVGEYDAASALKGRVVSIERMDGSLIASGFVTGVDVEGRIVMDVEGEDGMIAEKTISSGEAHVTF